ncbi:RanBP1 domain [Carpediemonas membranifera]|uniref:RanBP1 domain n=1 Tax=Carpediemonas membranifera TaxID=201153 RepID=A0A8J6AUX9_9EUKA|nr:RanBP1 domain [Carpediemonas membranifera]|eukprot:KAG9395386.1 RanBP1 domain [Carpediemonas membranifera]
MEQQEETHKPDVVDTEDIFFSIRAKLWRLDSSANEWKERGVGEARILHHKESGWYRVVMRRDKTHKVCANFVVHPSITLAPSAGSDRSFVFTCKDYGSEGEITEEIFAIKLQTPELATEFLGKMKEAQEHMEKVIEAMQAKKADEPAEPAAEEPKEEAKEEKEEEKKEEEPKAEEEKAEPEEEKKEEEAKE